MIGGWPIITRGYNMNWNLPSLSLVDPHVFEVADYDPGICMTPARLDQSQMKIKFWLSTMYFFGPGFSNSRKLMIGILGQKSYIIWETVLTFTWLVSRRAEVTWISDSWSAIQKMWDSRSYVLLRSVFQAEDPNLRFDLQKTSTLPLEVTEGQHWLTYLKNGI